MTAATVHEPQGRHQTRMAAASGWIGSALEYYDFFIYATAASLVFPQIFFPSTNPTVAIVASLATYGVGYVARPIGAFVLGHWGDTTAARTCFSSAFSSWASRRWRSGCFPPIAGRGLGADISCGLAPNSGLCGCWRDIRRELHDSRARPLRPARLFRELYAARRAGGADPGGGGLFAVDLYCRTRPSPHGGGACHSC